LLNCVELKDKKIILYLEGELKKVLLKGDHCTAVSPFANRERGELRKPCFHHLNNLKSEHLVVNWKPCSTALIKGRDHEVRNPDSTTKISCKNTWRIGETLFHSTPTESSPLRKILKIT
jgi:hypothetical protein